MKRTELIYSISDSIGKPQSCLWSTTLCRPPGPGVSRFRVRSDGWPLKQCVSFAGTPQDGSSAQVTSAGLQHSQPVLPVRRVPVLDRDGDRSDRVSDRRGARLLPVFLRRRRGRRGRIVPARRRLRTERRWNGGSGWRRAERNAAGIAEIAVTRGRRNTASRYMPMDVIKRRETHFRRTRALPRSNDITLFVYRYYRDRDIVWTHWFRCYVQIRCIIDIVRYFYYIVYYLFHRCRYEMVHAAALQINNQNRPKYSLGLE